MNNTAKIPKAPQYVYAHPLCWLEKYFMYSCMLGKFHPQKPVYYLHLWSEATSRGSGSGSARFHFHLAWMLQFTQLLLFATDSQEHLPFRCLRATWTTARTQTTPGWRKPSSTSTWTEKVRRSKKLTTWCGYINTLHGATFQSEFSYGCLIRCFLTPQVASNPNVLQWQKLSSKSSLMPDHLDSLRRVAEKHNRKFWCPLLFFVAFSADIIKKREKGEKKTCT